MEDPIFLEWLDREAGKAQLEAERYQQYLSRSPLQRGSWTSVLRPETMLIVYQGMTPREAVLAVLRGNMETRRAHGGEHRAPEAPAEAPRAAPPSVEAEEPAPTASSTTARTVAMAAGSAAALAAGFMLKQWRQRR
ncbi:hypothetical protein [Nocardioides daphniae]|uniref:Uncharacterized protein n=1 Tax=Nocardioides daphniae TaxID=402297 RepID=A0A4P7U8Y3_9ACTN|nr:hypothetical protein [Nocardioides daphniae]QCC76466.1 hypothetical protein E2C04_03165 [Nocardioides daphniae]GGD06525.1 hypothetical protein GCM10007231_01520 [Nocardioides daphniae]